MGVAVFVIATSALLALATTAVAVALFEVKLGTMLPADPVTDSAMFVPEGVPAFTCNTNVKLAVAFNARLLPSVQVMEPVPPTAGVMQLQPAGAVMDWKFVLAGVDCVNVTVVAAAGPRFFKLCV